MWLKNVVDNCGLESEVDMNNFSCFIYRVLNWLLVTKNNMMLNLCRFAWSLDLWIINLWLIFVYMKVEFVLYYKYMFIGLLNNQFMIDIYVYCRWICIILFVHMKHWEVLVETGTCIEPQVSRLSIIWIALETRLTLDDKAAHSGIGFRHRADQDEIALGA